MIQTSPLLEQTEGGRTRFIHHYRREDVGSTDAATQTDVEGWKQRHRTRKWLRDRIWMIWRSLMDMTTVDNGETMQDGLGSREDANSIGWDNICEVDDGRIADQVLITIDPDCGRRWDVSVYGNAQCPFTAVHTRYYLLSFLVFKSPCTLRGQKSKSRARRSQPRHRHRYLVSTDRTYQSPNT